VTFEERRRKVASEDRRLAAMYEGRQLVRGYTTGYKILPDGTIQFHNMAPSGEWFVVGAVTRNNFGQATRHWSLYEILRAPDKIPWKFKNSKQQTFILAKDHGTLLEWAMPTHFVF
jgi:hypothetical protein